MMGLGEEIVCIYLDVEGYLRSVSTALGFDPSAMVKSQDQRDAEADKAAELQQQMNNAGQAPVQ